MLVPPEDPIELASVVERLLADRRWAAQLASHGRGAWTARFTARHSAQAFLDALSDLE